MKRSRIGAIGLAALAAGCATGGTGRWPGSLDIRAATAMPREVVDAVPVSGTLTTADDSEALQSSAAGEAVNDVLALMFSVPASRAEALRRGQWVELSSDAVPGMGFLGRLAFVSPIEAQTRWVPIIAHVPNEDGALRPGLAMRGHVLLAARTALEVPRAALRDWDTANGRARVFVIEAGGPAARHVRIGAVHGDTVEITDGLGTGDVVATRLQPGWTSSPWSGRTR